MKKIRKNLLIICEGENTEPNYFYDIRNKLIENGVEYSIEIRPKPPQEAKDAEENLPEFKLRKGAKKRIVTGKVIEDLDLIEEKYKAQPTRYVREAQLGLIDGTYEEAWAVYDLDGHADHKTAYELANQLVEGKKVFLGFSSISFEMWVLWHFEANSTAFVKSQCRTGKNIHNCGQGMPTNDCRGEACVTGYMKTMRYISAEQNVKGIRFNQLKGNLHNALINTLNIRNLMIAAQPQTEMYKINPISTLDRLVFKLLNLPLDYIWIDDKELSILNFEVTIKFDENVLRLKFKNNNTIIGILHPDFVVFVSVNGEIRPILEKKILMPKDFFEFEIDLKFKDFAPSYIAFKKSDNAFYITEMPHI